MRSLFVRALAVAVVAVAGLAAAPVALHRGDEITDRQLFAYLAYPPQPGDWVRYRVDFGETSTVIKTIGFGFESVGGVRTLFIETHVRALTVTGLPAESTIGVGTDAVLKTYVAGTAFADLAHPYRVIASALHVGSFEYEVTPGGGETYSALSGAVYSPPRSGTVQSVKAVDMQVGGQTLHATHVVASFAAVPLPVGGVATGYTLEIWQSPEAPLGTVAIANAQAREVQWRLIAFGRGGYQSLFSKTLDQIRASSRPDMP
jgi:hypothetical protein